MSLTTRKFLLIFLEENKRQRWFDADSMKEIDVFRHEFDITENYRIFERAYPHTWADVESA